MEEKIDDEEVIISIPDEDGASHDASLLYIFTTERGQEYAALLSHQPDEDGSYPIEVFRCTVKPVSNDGEGKEEEEIELENIPSDMEYDEARTKLEGLLNGEIQSR